MPGAIDNYWLGIMALAFVLAVVVWVGLVFWANRRPAGKPQDSWPHRDVIGGAFSAREGGRQVTPDPRLPPESEAEVEAERQATERQAAEPQQQGAPRPPTPRESPETGVETGRGAEVKTGRT